MNPLVELNLALILFIPWYAILAVLFWLFPRQPRTAARKAFDTASLVLATALSAASMYWSMGAADTRHHMWQQVLATSVSYGVFLGVMALAVLLRWRWLRNRAAAPGDTTALEGATP
ncbi:hypothetical protein [Novilysobacter arseniciresistens]|uniref:hypothetical protein n=1 Tax=Novilysobacter arseniciresistens TaxID=1385522 RepID=UPI00055A3716|nr:hypothetical protein [Lysobacter arseniciresistens]